MIQTATKGKYRQPCTFSTKEPSKTKKDRKPEAPMEWVKVRTCLLRLQPHEDKEDKSLKRWAFRFWICPKSWQRGASPPSHTEKPAILHPPGHAMRNQHLTATILLQQQVTNDDEATTRVDVSSNWEKFVTRHANKNGLPNANAQKLKWWCPT